MDSFSEDMKDFQNQLRQGSLQRAYRGLMQFMLDLKTQFAKKYPGYSVSGALYPGYMDMTYFAIVPEALKQRSLKIAVVFVFEKFRFEVWLSGANRQVQAQVWGMIKASGWERYRLVADPRTADAVVEHILVADPDFRDQDVLVERITDGTMEFIQDILTFLNNQEISDSGDSLK